MSPRLTSHKRDAAVEQRPLHGLKARGVGRDDGDELGLEELQASAEGKGACAIDCMPLLAQDGRLGWLPGPSPSPSASAKLMPPPRSVGTWGSGRRLHRRPLPPASTRLYTAGTHAHLVAIKSKVVGHPAQAGDEEAGPVVAEDDQVLAPGALPLQLQPQRTEHEGERLSEDERAGRGPMPALVHVSAEVQVRGGMQRGVRTSGEGGVPLQGLFRPAAPAARPRAPPAKPRSPRGTASGTG